MDRVFPVKQALQGHPESPRLWATHVYKILTTLGFKSCPHELCLCSGIFYNKHVFFLKQVEDFVIACSDKTTTNKLLDHLDSTLKQPLKCQDNLSSFNSLNIEETSLHSKLSCSTYLKRTLANQNWLTPSTPHIKTLISSDSKLLAELCTSISPPSVTESKALQTQLGFKFRQGIS